MDNQPVLLAWGFGGSVLHDGCNQLGYWLRNGYFLHCLVNELKSITKNVTHNFPETMMSSNFPKSEDTHFIIEADI